MLVNVDAFICKNSLKVAFFQRETFGLFFVCFFMVASVDCQCLGWCIHWGLQNTIICFEEYYHSSIEEQIFLLVEYFYKDILPPPCTIWLRRGIIYILKAMINTLVVHFIFQKIELVSLASLAVTFFLFEFTDWSIFNLLYLIWINRHCYC